MMPVVCSANATRGQVSREGIRVLVSHAANRFRRVSFPAEGVEADPAKIETIQTCSLRLYTSKNVQRLGSLVPYSNLIPNFARTDARLPDPLKKGK